MKKIIMLLAAVMMVVGFSSAALAGSSATANANANSAVNNIAAPIIAPVNNSPVVTIEGATQRDLTTTNINARGYRGFAVPGDIPIPAQGPAYFSNTTPGPQFQSMKIVLMYKNMFTVSELTLMATGCVVDVMPNPLISKLS